jgi:hypothetical protein
MIRLILAAALVGGALSYVFGEARKPAQRRRITHARGAARRKRGRAARAAASSPR